jgi:gamma-glutamyltranspeptidase/glutathione hydrolase
MKLAFADRDGYIADPRFVDVPVDTLLSENFAQARRATIRANRAFAGMPQPGAIDVRDAYSAPVPTAQRASAGAHDTSHISVIDRHGNVFCATPSDPSYDMPVVPGTGLCPSSRGSQSWGDPRHPACVAPGKRPRLTPMAAMAIASDGSLMPFGTPGGDVQAQALLQALLNMTVFEMTPQQAVEAPRFASYSFPDSFEPHSYSPGVLYVERRISPDIRAGLAARGHEVLEWPDFVWRAGAVCVQRRDAKTGVIAAGADPRRPGYAVGW